MQCFSLAVFNAMCYLAFISGFFYGINTLLENASYFFKIHAYLILNRTFVPLAV
jgi:hypothetical protein